MTRDEEGYAPSVWIRAAGGVGAAYILVYSAVGLWRNDLFVSLSKASGDGVHLHRPLAWLWFAGAVLFSSGLFGLVAPQRGDGDYDIAARRRRFGPILLVGLALFIASQVIARVYS
jgi:hypothetical protein